MKQRNKAYHEELRGMDIDDCYAAVNHIQDTPWQFNRQVLDVMQEVWSTEGTLGGLPQRDDDPVPAKPHDIDTGEEAKAAWKREAGMTYARNAERVSSRIPEACRYLGIGRSTLYVLIAARHPCFNSQNIHK